jgi:hypothetical protein
MNLTSNDRALQTALNGSTETPPELVWRGLGVDVELPRAGASGGIRLSELKTGDIVQMNGFQSTSIDPHFPVAEWGRRFVLEIKPKRGLYVEPISVNQGEWEFLLPHGQRYRIVGRKTITVRSAGGNLKTAEVIQMEMF